MTVRIGVPELESDVVFVWPMDCVVDCDTLPVVESLLIALDVFVWPIDSVIVRSTVSVSVAEGETVPETLKMIDQLLDPNSVCESLGVFVSE